MSDLVEGLYEKATEEIEIGTSWGFVKVQIFGQRSADAKPIVALHGYLDNSNSFLPLASYLTKHGYYVIALDTPGHGFSSHLPQGLHYAPKIILTTLRRVIKHFNLTKCTIIGHSFGSINSMMYSACYPDEVEALVLIDPILGPEREKPLKEITQVWKKSIDDFIDYDMSKDQKKEEADKEEKQDLTQEIAIEKLLKANKHLNETAARILIQRALVEKDDKLEFSRDIRLKVQNAAQPYYYLDFLLMAKTFHENIKCPLLHIHAWPAPYGEVYFNGTMDFFTTLKANKKDGEVEIVKFDGTHHFHMLEPEKASSIILDFLKKKQEV